MHHPKTFRFVSSVIRFFIVIACLTLFSAPVFAYSGYMSRIPNSGELGCQVCHSGVSGGSLNSFGRAFTDWASVCPLDSDGDTFTNGVELQDSGCTWAIDDPAPGTPSLVTNPGDPDDFPSTGPVCGNGIKEGDEECDIEDLGEATCESQGFDGGQLACDSDCTFNEADCTQNPEPDDDDLGQDNPDVEMTVETTPEVVEEQPESEEVSPDTTSPETSQQSDSSSKDGCRSVGGPAPFSNVLLFLFVLLGLTVAWYRRSHIE